MNDDRIGKLSDIDMLVKRTNEMVIGVFLVTLKSALDSDKVRIIQMGHLPSCIIMRPCRYNKFCVNTLWNISRYLEPRNNGSLSSLILLLSPLYWKSAGWRRQARVSTSSLLFRRRVMWLEPCDLHERKPWCIQEIIRATQAGFRGMQIFSECLKNNTPKPPHPTQHTHTHHCQMLPPPHTHWTTMHTHTYITQQRNKKQQPAPWQNSPQVHLHKTLSLTKWLHLTSWVGGRTSPVAASYLQILQSFSRQATVSWPPL